MTPEPNKFEILSVSNLLDNQLHSRDSVALLFNRHFVPNQTIRVDFANVNFITRSAAHQLHTEKNRLEEFFKCNVEFNNLSHDLQKMFDTVKNSMYEQPKASEKVTIVHLENQSALNDFLMRF